MTSQMIGIFFGVVIIYLALAIRWVPKPYHWVIEINFPGAKTMAYEWEPGIHVLWFPVKPIMFVRSNIDTAQKPVTVHLGMGEGKGVGRPDPIDFKDTKAGAMIQVIYQVIDPVKATYHVQENDLHLKSTDESGQSVPIVFKGYERATLNKLEAELRSLFGSYDFDKANEDKIKTLVEDAVMGNEALHEIIAEWGVKVLVVDIIEFILDKDVSDLRQRRLAAKTQAEVLKTEAEGEKTATITIAEGKKQAALLAGEGERDRLKVVMAAGLDSQHAAAYVIAQGSIEQLGKANTTIIATSEGGNMSFPATVAGMFKGMTQEKTIPPTLPDATPSEGTPPKPNSRPPAQGRRRGNP